MRARRIAVSLVLMACAVAALPAAPAESYSGSLAAQGLFVQGPLEVEGRPLLARVGGTGNSFATPPDVVLTAERVLVERHSFYLLGLTPLDVPVHRGPDPTRTQHTYENYTGVTVVADAWLPRDAEIVVASQSGAAATRATVSGRAEAPTPLATLRERFAWTVGPDAGEFQAGVTQPIGFEAAAGDLLFAGTSVGQSLRATGDFDVVLYGADYRILHRGGVAHHQTGLRKDAEDPAGATDGYWYNVTKISVLGGTLTVDPQLNPVNAFAAEARLTGTGSLLFKAAVGHLQEAGAGAVAVEAQDVNLVGTYELAVRGAEGTLLAAVAGDFDASAIGFSVTRVAGSGFPWWWLLVGIGLVAGGGAGGALLLRRRVHAVAATPVAAPGLATPRPEEEAFPDARPAAPGFTWDDLSAEFGVMRAGERAGILVVLVPEHKVKNFLDAVVKRGLIAEDTGDRVHAAEHTLAVITLEPSPVMMN